MSLLIGHAYSSNSRVEGIDHADTESTGNHPVGSVAAGLQYVDGDGRAGSDFLQSKTRATISIS